MKVLMGPCSACISFMFSKPFYEIMKVDQGSECLPLLSVHFFILLVQRKWNLSVDFWHENNQNHEFKRRPPQQKPAVGDIFSKEAKKLFFKLSTQTITTQEGKEAIILGNDLDFPPFLKNDYPWFLRIRFLSDVNIPFNNSGSSFHIRVINK